MKQQQGFFQIVAIMMIMLMATIGLVLVIETGDQANISASFQNGLQTYYLAQAGMQVAKRQLQRADASRVTCDVLSGAATVTNASFGNGTFTATSTISNTTVTTLTAAITSSATTIPVTSTTGFAASGMLVLGSEYLYYGSISGNSFTGVARGVQGSTAAAAAAGSSLSQHQCAVSVSAGIPSVAVPTYQTSLSQYLNLSYAYIANSGSNLISICPVYANHTLNSCVTHADASFNKPFQIVLNKTATVAYVLNNNHKVSVCALNTNGTIGTCSAFTDTSFAFSYSGGAINSAGTYLYIANYTSSKVSICPISTGGALRACTTSTGSNTFNGPNDIVLTASYAYIANARNNTISICPLTGSKGTFGKCTTTTAGGALSTPGGLDTDPHYANLYIVNKGNNKVTICPINSGGTLGACSTTTGSGTFNFAVSTTANGYISNSGYAYFSNSRNNTISMCPVNANGTLGTCTADTDTSYNSDSGVAISYGKIV